MNVSRYYSLELSKRTYYDVTIRNFFVLFVTIVSTPRVSLFSSASVQIWVLGQSKTICEPSVVFDWLKWIIFTAMYMLGCDFSQAVSLITSK
jgi:hypothetical protein